MALNLLLGVFENLAMSIRSNIGNIFEAFLIILIGWLLGKLVGTLIKKALDAVKIDRYFKIDNELKVSVIFSGIIKWVVYLIFIQAALAELEIAILTEYFGKVVSLIQSLLGAFLVLTVGYFVGKYAEKYFKRKKHEYSKLTAQGVYVFTMIISLSMALEVVGLSTVLVNNIILIITASLGLGAAIAIGNGLKGTVKEIAEKYKKKK